MHLVYHQDGLHHILDRRVHQAIQLCHRMDTIRQVHRQHIHHQVQIINRLVRCRITRLTARIIHQPHLLMVRILHISSHSFVFKHISEWLFDFYLNSKGSASPSYSLTSPNPASPHSFSPVSPTYSPASMNSYSVSSHPSMSPSFHQQSQYSPLSPQQYVSINLVSISWKFTNRTNFIDVFISNSDTDVTIIFADVAELQSNFSALFTNEPIIQPVVTILQVIFVILAAFLCLKAKSDKWN